MIIDLDLPTGAVLSDDGRYRYLLWRNEWHLSTRGLLGFVMLNPSTADARTDDPTIRRCLGFARRLEYGGILVANVFAWRATDPRNLPRSTDEAFGPDNAISLAMVAEVCPVVVAAWGAHPRASDLAQRVLGIVGPLYCLGTTKSGAPRHPLYIRRDAVLSPWPGEVTP